MRPIHSFLKVLALTLTVIFGINSQPAQADEELQYMGTDIMVQLNGTLVITEIIKLKAEGEKIQRGIIRTYRTAMATDDGRLQELFFKVNRVMRDRKDEPFREEKTPQNFKIIIGNPDVLLQPAVYEYTIQYTVTNAIAYYPDKEKLVWNATGEWPLPMKAGISTVRLPGSINQTTVIHTGYTQKGEAKSKKFKSSFEKDGSLMYFVTEPLQEQETLVLDVTWPRGGVKAAAAK